MNSVRKSGDLGILASRVTKTPGSRLSGTVVASVRLSVSTTGLAGCHWNQQTPDEYQFPADKPRADHKVEQRVTAYDRWLWSGYMDQFHILVVQIKSPAFI